MRVNELTRLNMPGASQTLSPFTERLLTSRHIPGEALVLCWNKMTPTAVGARVCEVLDPASTFTRVVTTAAGRLQKAWKEGIPSGGKEGKMGAVKVRFVATDEAQVSDEGDWVDIGPIHRGK